jgi:hypothetical protein
VSPCHSEVSIISRPWQFKGCWAVDPQHMISDAAIEPVAYDKNFELKKLELLIKFPFFILII